MLWPELPLAITKDAPIHALTSLEMEKPLQEQPADSQRTQKGYEIPVPTKKSVMRFFEKVAKPKKG